MFSVKMPSGRQDPRVRGVPDLLWGTTSLLGWGLPKLGLVCARRRVLRTAHRPTDRTDRTDPLTAQARRTPGETGSPRRRRVACPSYAAISGLHGGQRTRPSGSSAPAAPGTGLRCSTARTSPTSKRGCASSPGTPRTGSSRGAQRSVRITRRLGTRPRVLFGAPVPAAQRLVRISHEQPSTHRPTDPTSH